MAAEILCSGNAFRAGQHLRLMPCPNAVPVRDESVPDIASGCDDVETRESCQQAPCD
jgi:hypothetical protein